MKREDGTPLIALDNQIQDEALLPEYIKIEKENKWGPRMSMVNPDQDEAVALLIQIQEERDLDLESEPSGVEKIIETCCELDNQFNLISEAYHLLYGGPNNLLDESSHQTEIETPMKISVLHIAAWNGNDDIVARLIKRAPKLLSENNKNNDSVLHVAARGGNISTVKILLEGYTRFQMQQLKTMSNSSRQSKDDFEQRIREELLTFVKRDNNQGNTMFHEVMLCDKSKIGGNMIFNVCEIFQTKDQNQKSSSNSCYDYTIDIVNHAKKTVLYLAVENGKKDAVDLILEKCRKNDLMPKGLSPFVAAIMMHNQEMMRIIQKHKPTWIHSKDKHERLPLHYAASIGYLEGVNFLLELCECCTIQRDKNGYFPIHLASYGGHVEVVKKLLQYCPDPTEMLDYSHERNILHIAANHGKHEVVCYILQSEILKHHKLINQKDNKGDTPLHLAARSCHPTTVYYIVNEKNKRVNIDLVNKNNETALDIVNALYGVEKSSLRQNLTWSAFKSAGAKQSLRKVRPHNEESQQSEKQSKEKENDSERYKDRIENLTVVSTLILTASVAACLAVPGEADGNANNLNHAMFQFFILFITISLFSSISATIILFWATLGLTELVTFTLKIVMPLLGIALISLALAFMGGIYTVISKLSWLANVFLVISVIFIIVVVLLYILLFLPSSSTIKPLRYISHYPFLYLASRAERKIDQGLKPWG
ncbi:protein ACCELERATED CELL DEATH 6-like [Vicia villosa]|uniref:protein ACCELERATED CELL DEATH 6-like n=1 Tax=Vicia villosa TaxID=3911 RepID=UPI00273B7855|nr:protein ACCELERATED CELL DEATH 6-like [Vicia villosa]